MKMAPQSHRFAASRLQVGNGPPAPAGQPKPDLHPAVTTVPDFGFMMSATVQPLQLTILVVDDEEPLRHYMGRVMADEGYRVLAAGNGLEALALLEKCGPGIHLVITDVSMPIMTGPEMAARLAIQPDPPPVLFVSGGHCLSDLPGPLLRKPFLPDDLSTLVRGLLRGSANSWSIAGVGAV
jgi:CheY-like chemotaxis protein